MLLRMAAEVAMVTKGQVERGAGGGWLRVGAAEGGGAGGGQPRAGAVAAKEQVGDSQRTDVGEGS